ncbi:hypothetical protein [Salinibaculum rarum]|uniref:hypothetical protein n=1 Tax=Salinibaculum rarum TaxID=3058903 RepID=UPI00265D7B1A|nr:hypothetical protein [Salinibaculum sp. KK48]
MVDDSQNRPSAFDDPRIVNRVETIFENMEDNLNLPPKTVARARSILIDGVNNSLIDKRGYETAIAACTLIACRETDVPRTVKEIGSVVDIQENDILSVSRKFHAELGIEISTFDAMTFLERYIEEFDPSQETVNKAFDLLMLAQDQDLDNGRSPSGVAAGALYAAARLTGENIKQPDLAAISDVSEPTIRKNYRTQLEASDFSAESA